VETGGVGVVTSSRTVGWGREGNYWYQMDTEGWGGVVVVGFEMALRWRAIN
jgi:hypothetical protein